MKKLIVRATKYQFDEFEVEKVKTFTASNIIFRLVGKTGNVNLLDCPRQQLKDMQQNQNFVFFIF